MQAYIDYFTGHWQDYLLLFWQHIYISALAVVIAVAIGVPCGLLCLILSQRSKSLSIHFSVH